MSEQWAEEETRVGRPHKLQEAPHPVKELKIFNNVEEVTVDGLMDLLGGEINRTQNTLALK